MKVLIVIAYIVLFSFVDVAVIPTGGFIPYLILIYMMRLSCEAYDARKYNKKHPAEKIKYYFNKLMIMTASCIVSLLVAKFIPMFLSTNIYEEMPTMLIKFAIYFAISALPLIVGYFIAKFALKEQYEVDSKLLRQFNRPTGGTATGENTDENKEEQQTTHDHKGGLLY